MTSRPAPHILHRRVVGSDSTDKTFQRGFKGTLSSSQEDVPLAAQGHHEFRYLRSVSSDDCSAGKGRAGTKAARSCTESLLILTQPCPQKFWWLRSLPLVLFLLLFPLLCSLVLLHSRVHHLEVTSDPSWPAHFAAHTFFGYNIGDLAFLLSKPSFLIETVSGRHRFRDFLPLLHPRVPLWVTPPHLTFEAVPLSPVLRCPLC